MLNNTRMNKNTEISALIICFFNLVNIFPSATLDPNHFCTLDPFPKPVPKTPYP